MIYNHLREQAASWNAWTFNVESQRNRAYQEHLWVGWRQGLVTSLFSRKKSLVGATKNYVKTDINVFWSFSFLLVSFIWFAIFFEDCFITKLLSCFHEYVSVTLLRNKKYLSIMVLQGLFLQTKSYSCFPRSTSIKKCFLLCSLHWLIENNVFPDVNIRRPFWPYMYSISAQLQTAPESKGCDMPLVLGVMTSGSFKNNFSQTLSCNLQSHYLFCRYKYINFQKKSSDVFQNKWAPDSFWIFIVCVCVCVCVCVLILQFPNWIWQFRSIIVVTSLNKFIMKKPIVYSSKRNFCKRNFC